MVGIGSASCFESSGTINFFITTIDTQTLSSINNMSFAILSQFEEDLFNEKQREDGSSRCL